MRPTNRPWTSIFEQLRARFSTHSGLARYLDVSTASVKEMAEGEGAPSEERRDLLVGKLEQLEEEKSVALDAAIAAKQTVERLRQAETMEEVEEALDKIEPLIEKHVHRLCELMD